MASRKNFFKTLPVMAGYLVLRAGFGIVLQSKGYGVWYALAMSFLIYAGAMQFVAVNLIIDKQLKTKSILSRMKNNLHTKIQY